MSISISGNGTFTGVSTNYSCDKNVSIGGTLTYEDVTNVDSIGIVTARQGVVIGTGASIGNPANNELSLHTDSSERLRIDSSGRVLVGVTSDISDDLSTSVIQGVANGGGFVHLGRNDSSVGDNNNIGGIRFSSNDPSGYNRVGIIQCTADGTHQADDYPTRLEFHTTADGASSPIERMQINSSGNGANVTLKHNTTAGSIGLADTLGRINFTDSNNGEFASIRCENDGIESNLDYPGRITFWTTPDNASSSIERLRISETGSVSVGSTLGRNGPGTLICHSASDQGFRLSRNAGRNYLEFVVETAGTSTENHFSIDVPNANIIIYILMDYVGSRQTSSDPGNSRIGFENYVIARRIDQDVTFGSNYNSLNFEVNGPDAGGANDKQAVNPFMQRTGSEASTATQQVEVQVQPRCSNGSNGWVTSHVRMIINGTIDYNDFRVIVD